MTGDSQPIIFQLEVGHAWQHAFRWPGRSRRARLAGTRVERFDEAGGGLAKGSESGALTIEDGGTVNPGDVSNFRSLRC